MYWVEVGLSIALVLDVFFLVAIAALARELAIVLSRLPPTIPRHIPDGPAIGEHIAAKLEWTDILGGRHDAASASPRLLLLLFTRKGCEPCQNVLQVLASFAQAYRQTVAVRVINEGDEDYQAPPWPALTASSVAVFRANAETRALGVQTTPYAIVVSPSQTIRNRGVINNLRQLESLIELEKVVIPGRDRSPWNDPALHEDHIPTVSEG